MKYYCVAKNTNISIFSPLTFNTDERRVGIPLIDLNPPYVYACPKIVPGFPTKYGIFVFSELYSVTFIHKLNKFIKHMII
jgi:hypothetical protein